MNLVQVEDKLFLFAVLIYALTMVLYFFSYINKSEKIGTRAQNVLMVAFIIHTIAIIVRGIASKRVPLTNQYEFATAFAWGIALFLIIFEKKVQVLFHGYLCSSLTLNSYRLCSLKK